MDSLAAEAFLNAEHRIYGLRMRPLSLGHAFALEALSSPFYHGQLGSEQELRLAAWICAHDPLMVPRASGWRYWAWNLATKYFDFDQQVSRWVVYSADYVAPPQMWSKVKTKEEIKQSRIPGAISSVVRLMRLGMTEKQAWATPVGAATWYEAAYFESEAGTALDIVTDSERTAIARHKQKQKAKSNG
jgi:hypothetical protein